MTKSTFKLMFAIMSFVLMMAHEAPSANEITPQFLKVDLDQDRKDDAAIASWAVRSKDSHVLTLRGDVAKRFGLTPGKDIDGKGVLMSNSAGIKMGVYVFSQRPEIVFLYNTEGEEKAEGKYEVYWLVKDGILTNTVIADRNKNVVSLNNPDFYRVFDQIKQLLLKKATAPNDQP